MAERRKTKRKKETEAVAESEKPAKVEFEIAKYLRSKLPAKKTTLMSHKVDYFIASKAIDLLMDSKWAKDDKKKTEALFTSRQSVADFMEQMLRHKFFHRAKTVVVKKDKKKKVDNEESSCNEEHIKDKKKSKKELKEVKDAKDSKDGKEESKEKEDSKEVETKKKEKKKIKLDMHLEQIFVDENEPYVWIYDPIPLKTWLIGAGLVLAAIAVCLFPLWPRTVRNYVYYLSIAAAAFLFFIIGLAVLRLVIFTIVWVVTFGKHHFWLLPNLTEDVGFFESFWPLYKHELKADDKDKDKDKDRDHKKKKRKNSDESTAPLVGADSKTNADNKESGSESASTVESTAKSNASNESKDVTNGLNGFEILDSNELDDDQNETSE